MSDNLSLAQQFAYSLAASLMVCITVFKGETGFGVVPSNEFDGDPETILQEIDPWA